MLRDLLLQAFIRQSSFQAFRFRFTDIFQWAGSAIFMIVAITLISLAYNRTVKNQESWIPNLASVSFDSGDARQFVPFERSLVVSDSYPIDDSSPLLSLSENYPRLDEKKSLPPVDQRFSDPNTTEVPDFQRHVVPLFTNLGCNGRACHGSFQGQGGLQLSLFGYDFQHDHDMLFDEESPRVDLEDPESSLMLDKPTLFVAHGGGKRIDEKEWEYRLLYNWIEGGGKLQKANSINGDKNPKATYRPQPLQRLEVYPKEIIAKESQQQINLKAYAHWPDGTVEEVTPLCRFQTNDDQIATITKEGEVTLQGKGDTHVVVFYDQAVVPVEVIVPYTDQTDLTYSAPTTIDRLVAQKWEKLGIVPSPLSDDATFLRRVRLDMTGTLPTSQEVKNFLKNTDPDKRARKIDELLATPEYVAWSTTQLCNITGNNDTQLVNASVIRNRAPSREWYHWIYQRVEENLPYDDLVAGIVLAQSRRPGQTYTEYSKEMSEYYHENDTDGLAERPSLSHYWARRNVRTSEEKAISFAHSFLGVRIQCAQCHKHPFDRWSKDDFSEFQKFFEPVAFNARGGGPGTRAEANRLLADLGLEGKRGNEVRRALPDLLREGEVVPFPEVFVRTPRPRDIRLGKTNKARLLGESEPIDLNTFSDPREPLMDWLRNDEEHLLAKAYVNRVWANYFGIGIIDAPDDINQANPPSNRPLLDYLTTEFIRQNYDMKWLHREIANSRTYQLSWETNETNRLDNRNFSHARLKRMPAEVAYDAVYQATASSEEVLHLQHDLSNRAIMIPGTQVPRQQRQAAYQFSVFGRSTRSNNCDCDRSDNPNLLQTIYLQNDPDFLRLLTDRRSWLGQLQKEIQAEDVTARQKELATLDEKIKSLKQQMERQRKRLATLRNEKKQRQAQKVQKNLTQTTKELQRQQQSRKKIARQKQPLPMTIDLALVDDILIEAYLRTLSRYPTSEELAINREHLKEAGIQGMQDILWALLNTKEFIVNH